MNHVVSLARGIQDATGSMDIKALAIHAREMARDLGEMQGTKVESLESVKQSQGHGKKAGG